MNLQWSILPSPNFDHGTMHFSLTTKYVVLGQDPTQRQLCVLLGCIYGLDWMAVSLFRVYIRLSRDPFIVTCVNGLHVLLKTFVCFDIQSWLNKFFSLFLISLCNQTHRYTHDKKIYIDTRVSWNYVLWYCIDSQKHCINFLLIVYMQRFKADGGWFCV